MSTPEQLKQDVRDSELRHQEALQRLDALTRAYEEASREYAARVTAMFGRYVDEHELGALIGSGRFVEGGPAQ